MHGCGNDYIFFNCFEHPLRMTKELCARLSDRRKGIGGDGVILIAPSECADAKMLMYNADGSEGAMCGNGIRCVGKFLYDSGIARKTEISVETKSGVRALHMSVSGGVVVSARVNMGRPRFLPDEIPVNLPGDKVTAYPIPIGGAQYPITCVSMGNPHAVVFCENSAALDLEALGPLFENNPLFPARVNTEFVEVISRTHLKMRVWERGSGETHACGTGACAAAVAAVLNGHCEANTDIRVTLVGGELTVLYTGGTVYMTGECVKVFDGTVLL